MKLHLHRLQSEGGRSGDNSNSKINITWVCLVIVSIAVHQLLEGSNVGIWSSKYLLKSSDYRARWTKFSLTTGKYKFYLLISKWGVTWERSLIQQDQCLLPGQVRTSISVVLGLQELMTVQNFLHFTGFL